MIRLAVIGLGNIARQHIEQLLENDDQQSRLVAVCSRSKPAELESLFANSELQWFSDYKAVLDNNVCDAVIVASPSYTHFDIGKHALKAGIHVLMEKPMALSAAEASELIKLSQAVGDSQIQFGVMLNQRVDPLFQRMKRIIDDGEIGPITRTHWTMTNWFRPDVYFKVSDWRATWKGEGGGLLLNQCIHNLDIFQWLCGMPSSVRADCAFGKYHPIEVEDEASALFHYANGSTGVFVGSTGEAPGTNRLEIAGDKGKLEFDGTQLLLTKNAQSTSEFCATTTEMFGQPEATIQDITPSRDVNQHAILLKNFVSAVAGSEQLTASAEQGYNSLALANAMLLSSWTESDVPMPLDEGRYQQLLEQKIAGSKLRNAENIDVTIDMNKSYR